MTEILIKWTNTLGKDEPIFPLLPKRNARHIRKKRRMGREFRMTMDLGGYEMKEVMFNLGSNVNILPKKSREFMEIPNIVLSLI